MVCVVNTRYELFEGVYDLKVRLDKEIFVVSDDIDKDNILYHD